MSNDVMDTTHVFFLFYHLGLGGVQRKIVDIINFFDQNKSSYKRYTAHIAVRRTESFDLQSELPKSFKFLHIENYLTNNVSQLRYIVFLTYVIFEYNAKILVPFLYQSAIYCVLMKYVFFWKHIRVVISQDNVLSYENQLEYTRVVHSNFLIGWCYRRADCIITQTNFSRNDLIHNYGVDENKIFVIQNWATKSLLIQRQHKTFDLIYCGRFAPQKRLNKMLRLVREIRKTIPSISLCLIGDGPDKNKLVAYIKKHKLSDNVFLYPPTLRVIPQLAKAKIFLLTSDFECHPMVLIEAMCQRVVPILLRYPGVEEYISNKHNGFIEDNLLSLKNRILSTLANKQLIKQVGNNARQTILKHNNKTLIKKTLETILR